MKKYIYKLYVFIFFILQIYSNENDFNKEIKKYILINIIYRAIQRSKSTIHYFQKFKTYEIMNKKLHHNIASRIKNPSRDNITKELYKEFRNIYTEYSASIEEIIHNYNQYKLILNNLYSELDEIEKKDFNQCKKNTSLNIIKEILNIKNILSSIQNIVIEFNAIDKNILNSIKERLSLSITFLYTKINIYKAMVEIYNEIDNNLLQYDTYINNINIFFYQQCEKIWTTIESLRLKDLIALYNIKVKEYYEIHNEYPKKIIYDESFQWFIEDSDLPSEIKNNFSIE